MKNNPREKRRFKIPGIPVRMALYISAATFVALSVYQMSAAVLVKELGFIVYFFAGLFFFSACPCIIMDVLNLKKSLLRTLAYFEEKYEYVKLFVQNLRFRTFAFAASGFLINTLYAVFCAILGVISRSAWYVTLAAYYMSLGLMRMWIVSYEVFGKNKKNIKEKSEIKIYKRCSIALTLLTVVLGGMVVLTVHDTVIKSYPGFTIYAVALYTFVKLPRAVYCMIRDKKNTPLMMAIRRISYADALVSMMSLQTAMFCSFGKDSPAKLIKAMNSTTGALVCVLILTMGIYGIYDGIRKQKIKEGFSKRL